MTTVFFNFCIWYGILVNLVAIAFMVAAIWLIRWKVRLLNSRYGGTVHKVKLNEPVVAVHILMLLTVSAAYCSFLRFGSVAEAQRAFGVVSIFDSALSFLLSAIITNII